MNTRRAAGIGLLVYGLGTLVAFMSMGAPGGEYSTGGVTDFIARSHWVPAFVLAYLGAFCALGLLVFGRSLRSLLGEAGDTTWALAVAGTATSVVGWFVASGVDVAMAEGGKQVQDGVPAPVVYALTEIGNLLAVCSPAFFVGVAALLLSARLPMPVALRVFTVIAGVCGILAPLFFTYFVYALWTLVLGGVLAASRSAHPVVVQPKESLA
jgi:hypothetical protein